MDETQLDKVNSLAEEARNLTKYRDGLLQQLSIIENELRQTNNRLRANVQILLGREPKHSCQSTVPETGTISVDKEQTNIKLEYPE